VLLPNEVVKRLGPVFASENEVAHGTRVLAHAGVVVDGQ